MSSGSCACRRSSDAASHAYPSSADAATTNHAPSALAQRARANAPEPIEVKDQRLSPIVEGQASPCDRLHPGWRAGQDYQADRDLRGARQFVGPGAYALHVDHATQQFSDSIVIAPGAVLLYLGSTYWYDCYAETGRRIFQVLDRLRVPPWRPDRAASSRLARHGRVLRADRGDRRHDGRPLVAGDVQAGRVVRRYVSGPRGRREL